MFDPSRAVTRTAPLEDTALCGGVVTAKLALAKAPAALNTRTVKVFV